MENITTEKLDEKFAELMETSCNTTAEKTQRAISLSNLKHYYVSIGVLWPAMDARQRLIFNEARGIAMELGLEK